MASNEKVGTGKVLGYISVALAALGLTATILLWTGGSVPGTVVGLLVTLIAISLSVIFLRARKRMR
jgi:ABC-type Na+ efflux pump permease subunit